ncbi:hypothetical protein [Endozoicomonas sp.]|uniref:hypothetical protein n=1 Tax=Endozoicomonas sp. TaxID=1892382 RepID=UPI003AF4B145
MNVLFKKCQSDSDINAIPSGEISNITPGKPAFHVWNTRSHHSQSITKAAFRVESEASSPCTSGILTRSITSQEKPASCRHLKSTEHESCKMFTHDNEERTPEFNRQKKSTITTGIDLNFLSMEDSNDSICDIRETRNANRRSIRAANNTVNNDTHHLTTRSNSWWERSTNCNSILIISSITVAVIVLASLITDIFRDGDDALFQRSGAVLICWTALFGFINYSKRKDKEEIFEIVSKVNNKELPSEDNIRLMSPNYDIESARLIARRAKGRVSKAEWIMLLTSITGTLIWGYGDLPFKK